jgi:hypothetical protein
MHERLGARTLVWQCTLRSVKESPQRKRRLRPILRRVAPLPVVRLITTPSEPPVDIGPFRFVNEQPRKIRVVLIEEYVRFVGRGHRRHPQHCSFQPLVPGISDRTTSALSPGGHIFMSAAGKSESKNASWKRASLLRESSNGGCDRPRRCRSGVFRLPRA